MGLYERIRAGLRKTRESIGAKLGAAFHRVDEDFLEELEEILITSDVGAVCSEEICGQLRAAAAREHITDASRLRGLMREKVAEMIGGDSSMDLSTRPSVVLVIGVNGAGKTTTIGKLAAKYKAQGKKVIVAAADTFRAAAIEQLEEWTERAGVQIVKQAQGSDPAAVVYDAVSAAQARGADVLLCDTAGRLHNKQNLMKELEKISRVIKTRLPDAAVETLLVLDAVTGQNAVIQAREFSKICDVTGIVLTKLDGTAKGGIVIPIRRELGLPVKYVGFGEKIEDLQEFDPEAFAGALFDE